MNIEFEIKFYVDTQKVVTKLQQQGAKLICGNRLMKRINFTTFGKESSWARVRDEGDVTTFTIKKFDGRSSIDSVKELEVEVSSFELTVQMLQELGLTQQRYVENYRETWLLDNCKIMIDNWPGLDSFIEIEGLSKKDVYSVVALLDLDVDTARYGPTSKLYEEKYNISKEQFDKVQRLTFEDIPDFMNM